MVEVALPNADIPMLLGNNIFKPLGAHIEIFSSVNGILKLADREIAMKETVGRHYTIKVSDLGKVSNFYVESSVLCASNSSKQVKCAVCGNTFQNKNDLNMHVKEHGQSFKCSICSYDFKDRDCLQHHMKSGGCNLDKVNIKSILKNNKKDTMESEVSLEHLVTDLNTQLNGKPSKQEKKLINTMKSQCNFE